MEVQKEVCIGCIEVCSHFTLPLRCALKWLILQLKNEQ